MTDDRQEQRVSGAMVGLFAITAGLASADMIGDIGEGTTVSHLVIEGGVVLVGLFGMVLMGRRFVGLIRRQHSLEAETANLTGRLEASRADALRWRQETAELLRGLSASIDDQLTRWKLTPAEKEVSLLLLKGLSLKEIAGVRGVGEATARQQARAVYRKADLAGRSELAAFFLEDLLLPPEAANSDCENEDAKRS